MPTKPPVMLAHDYDESIDPTGWWVSEKLDGIRAWWDGTKLVSRLGNTFAAPDWFLATLPSDVLLDGELWVGRGLFHVATSTVRKKVPVDAEWQAIRYLVFDMPSGGVFENRLANFTRRLAKHPFAFPVHHWRCIGVDSLMVSLSMIVADGGEGLMLRKPGSRYESKRSHSLLKLKPSHDAEAVVVGHEPGEGKHAGRLGALVVEALTNGKRFKLGTGLTDAERENPPVVGTLVTYGYTELTPAGIPRFPRFIRVRADV